MNIAVVGGNGKLGKNIINELINNNYNAICVDITSKVKNLENLNQKIQINAIIDVSTPNNSLQSINYAILNKIPIIIGCTGHSEQQLKTIKKLSKQTPILVSYNFSIALQYFYKAIKLLSNLNSVNYISETHHIKKKDKPSGTAIEMKNIINKRSNVSDIFSLRAGNVIGEHSAEFICENELIKISHSVLDRKVFAQGAISALKFIINQKNGFYTMKNAVKNAK